MKNLKSTLLILSTFLCLHLAKGNECGTFPEWTIPSTVCASDAPYIIDNLDLKFSQSSSVYNVNGQWQFDPSKIVLNGQQEKTEIIYIVYDDSCGQEFWYQPSVTVKQTCAKDTCSFVGALQNQIPTEYCIDDDEIFLAWQDDIVGISGPGVSLNSLQQYVFKPSVADLGIKEIKIDLYHICNDNRVETSIKQSLWGHDCNSQTDGCTDTSALNFDTGANQDDGSCLYNGVASNLGQNQLQLTFSSESILKAKGFIKGFKEKTSNTYDVDWLVFIGDKTYDVKTYYKNNQIEASHLAVTLSVVSSDYRYEKTIKKGIVTDELITDLSEELIDKGIEINNHTITSLYEDTKLMTIINTNGQNISESREKTIDISGISAGVYVINVFTELDSFSYIFTKP